MYNSNITKDLHSYNTALLSEQGPVLEKQFCKRHKQRKVRMGITFTKQNFPERLQKSKMKWGITKAKILHV